MSTGKIKTYVLSVLIPTAIDVELTYKYEGQNINVGDVVVVPLRKKEIIGVVWSITTQDDSENIIHNKAFLIKNVIKILHPLNIDNNARQFIDWVAHYNISNRGMILKMMLGHLIRRHKKIMQLIHENQYCANTKVITNNGVTQKNNIHFSSEQQCVYNAIISSLHQYSVNVIDGATGSGKTKLYLQIANFVLSIGGQVLILLPEILLSSQISQRIGMVLGKEYKIYNWHSAVKPSSKDQIWVGVQTCEVKIIVGARSALFLPFTNLQLIIVDEEHDSSFKQDVNPIYDAKNMAIVRAKIYNIPILLVSATPSIETIYNVKLNKYRYFRLDKKFFITENTNMVVINMWDVKKNIAQKSDIAIHNLPLLHPTTIEYISATLAKNKQVLVFLNRKGYATTVLCRVCQSKIRCINCDVKLTYHKNKNILQCRHCKYIVSPNNKCNVCGVTNSIYICHYGIEKLEEEIKAIFCDARIMSMTADSIDNHSIAASIINKISNHEVDIVIGTQVIAKGLHFANMELCVVVDANAIRISNDIRGLERTYQILHQVMGRVGRENIQGTAILQTLSQNTPIVDALARNNLSEFLKLELENRKIAGVPPYGKFILINIRSVNEKKLKEWLAMIASTIPENSNDISIFGPSPALISKLNSKYRYCILFKSNRKTDLNSVVRAWASQLSIPSYIGFSIDVDPYSFV